MQPIHDLPGHRGAVRGLAFSPDGSVLATGDEAGRLRHWDVDAGRPRAAVMVGAPINVVAFLPHGREALAGCGDATALETWGTADASPLVRFGLDGSLARHQVTGTTLVDFVTDIAVGGDGRLALLTGGHAFLAGDDFAGRWPERGMAQVLWDVARGEPLWCVREVPVARPGVTRRGDGRRIDHELDGDTLVVEVPRPLAVPAGFALASQGTRALAWDRGRGELRVWDAAAGAWLGAFPWPAEDPPAAAAIAPDGRTIAVGSHQGRVWLLVLAAAADRRGGLEPALPRLDLVSGLEPMIGRRRIG